MGRVVGVVSCCIRLQSDIKNWLLHMFDDPQLFFVFKAANWGGKAIFRVAVATPCHPGRSAPAWVLVCVLVCLKSSSNYRTHTDHTAVPAERNSSILQFWHTWTVKVFLIYTPPPLPRCARKTTKTQSGIGGVTWQHAAEFWGWVRKLRHTVCVHVHTVCIHKTIVCYYHHI